MSNPERVARAVAHEVVGGQVWSFGQCATMPDAEYEASVDAGFALLAAVASAIDWPRLLVDAEARHATLHDGRSAGHGQAPVMALGLSSTTVCPGCLHEALIAHGESPFFPDWRAQPHAKPHAAGLDWAEVFARTIAYRKTEEAADATPILTVGA